MEDLEIDPHPDFVKGFNEGYLLSKELPELADKLAVAMGESDRAAGFKGGRQEYIEERTKDLLPNWLNRDLFKDRTEHDDKFKEQEKDLDGPDPDFEKE